MITIQPEIEILSTESYEDMLRRIEKIGRVCYKSEERIGEGTAEKFIAGIIKRGHESVIEHGSITVKVTCDRGVTHEIVRHRIASYSQESTRYCNYSKDKFGNQITCIDLATGFSYDLDDENDRKKLRGMAESNGSCRAVLLPDARTRSKAGGGKKHSSELSENRDRHDHELKRVAPLYPASKRQRRTSADASGI